MSDFNNPWDAQNTEWYGAENNRWNAEDQDSVNQSSTTGLRKVTITLTSKVVGKYEARSYPHDDIDENGLIELYEVSVHEIIVSGTDSSGNAKTYKHKAPRMMPYYNNPKKPHKKYKSLGWVNSGLYSARRVTVRTYIRDYQVQNRYSPGVGAIVIKDAFYIHGGPADYNNIGFGSAGCVEIIGNYDDFKDNIAALSGSSSADSDDAIEELVAGRKLILVLEEIPLPDIKSNFTREVAP